MAEGSPTGTSGAALHHVPHYLGNHGAPRRLNPPDALVFLNPSSTEEMMEELLPLDRLAVTRPARSIREAREVVEKLHQYDDLPSFPKVNIHFLATAPAVVSCDMALFVAAMRLFTARDSANFPAQQGLTVGNRLNFAVPQ
jgi:hypothetical protein